MEDEGYEPMELCEEEGEPEGPPKLSEAELAEVEKKAGKDEIVKLMERLNVIRPATDEEVNSGKILDRPMEEEMQTGGARISGR